MAASIDQRRILVTVRAASDLPNVAFTGKNTPYMEITIDNTTMTTKPNEMDPVNPVWDETFEFKVPGAAPEEEPLMLRVTVKNETTLLPDSTIGKGAVPLGQLWATGSEEARIPLTDNSGTAAGVAFVGIKVCTPEDQAEIPSAAGTVLGQVFGAPKVPGTGVSETIVPTTEVGAATQLVGAVAPGGFDDPSGPGYGIMQD